LSGATAARRGPGRPDTGAAERILEGAYAVLAREGYAGLTTAKVAAASGQNKALIAYHFGSKQGLVAAVARRVSETITDEVLGGIADPASARELVGATVEGLWRAMERDPGLQRVYFDLSSEAVVESEVGRIMVEMRADHRAILRRQIAALEPGLPAAELEAIAIYVQSGLEGLSLERLDRGNSAALKRASEIFVAAAVAAIEAS
jgi:TetR/AcrR family transcriptional repressor of bet genes